MIANQKTILIAAGVVGAMTALGAVTYAVMNSKRLRLFRAARQTSRILYRVGGTLQSVSNLFP